MDSIETTTNVSYYWLVRYSANPKLSGSWTVQSSNGIWKPDLGWQLFRWPFEYLTDNWMVPGHAPNLNSLSFTYQLMRMCKSDFFLSVRLIFGKLGSLKGSLQNTRNEVTSPYFKNSPTKSPKGAFKLWSKSSWNWALLLRLCLCTKIFHTSGFQIVGLPDFRTHSKSWPFASQLHFNHFKSRLARISDPHYIAPICSHNDLT